MISMFLRESALMRDDSLTDGLARVRLHFLNSLCDGFRRTTHLRMQIAERVKIKESLSEIGHIYHKIAGTAATLGFPELGATAAKIDDFVTAHIDGQYDPEPYLLAEIDQFLKATRAIISDHDLLSCS